MIIRNDARRALFAAGVIISAAATAGAQANTLVPRWDAWIGCWKPAVPATTAAAETPASSRTTVCVSSTNVSSAVEVATMQNGVVITRDTIDATGQQRPVSTQGCTGWERAQWSADVHRVYLRSEVTCADNIKRVATGLLGISPTGEWLDIQGIVAGGNSGVRVTRYTDAPGSLTESLPAIVGGTSTRQLAVNGARTAAGGALDVGAIVEAVKMVDTAVVQAWIVERGARFALEAKHLVALADAGVPGSVTDVMVGVSYPQHFALDQRVASGLAGDAELSPFDSARIVSRYLTERCFGGVDPFLYTVGIYDPCGSRYGYGAYGYGYGYRYGSYGYYGRGYPSYGYSSYGYAGYYGAPVVVVRGEQTQHGKVIKGVGYTPGSSSGSSSSGASSSRSGGSGSSSSGSSRSSGSSSSGSSGSSSSGSSGGRTAHPRPPA